MRVGDEVTINRVSANGRTLEEVVLVDVSAYRTSQRRLYVEQENANCLWVDVLERKQDSCGRPIYYVRDSSL